jgi:hypothetical protein
LAIFIFDVYIIGIAVKQRACGGCKYLRLYSKRYWLGNTPKFFFLVLYYTGKSGAAWSSNLTI